MRPSIAFGAVLASVLVAALGSPAAGALSGPRLTGGDSWTYRTNTSLGGAFYLRGDVTLTATGNEPFSVGGTTYDAVRFSLSGTGTANGSVPTDLGSTPASGTWVLSGSQVLESAGLKVISSILDLEASGTLHVAPVAIPFQLSVQNTRTFQILDDSWRFPIEIGNTSVVATRMNFTEDFRLVYGLQTTARHTLGNPWWNVTYALETQIALDTPAGHFDAYRIRESAPDGTYSLFYYAPAAGNDARTESYKGTSQVATTELTSYRYQALEPARFLGLTGADWAIVGLVVGAIAITVAAWWLRRHRGSAPPRTGAVGPRR